MSQPGHGVTPYHLAYSERCRESIRRLLALARERGRLAEILEVVRGIHTRLEWIPLDFGDPQKELVHLGIQERIGVCPPVVVTYAVDEARRIVYVSVPVKLLPRSGLE